MYKRNGIYYADFIHDGKRYVKSLKVSSKSVARELEQRFRVEVMTGEYDRKQERKKRDVKFNVVLNDYIENVSKVDKKSWKRDLVATNHLLRYFNKKRFLEITPDDVTAYKNKRQQEIIATKDKPVNEISFASINRELSLMKRLYNWYSEQKQIQIINPVKGIKMFKEHSRDRVMSDEEEQRFFANGKPPHYLKAIVTIALYTGMRKSEILNLRRKDVVLKDIGGYVILKDTKNGENRKVPLNNDLTEFFISIIKNVSIDEYLFPSKDGKRFDDVKKSWGNTCRRAGIEDLKFHDLRHTFCTRLAADGTSPFFIMKIVGHKDTDTAKRYTNPTEEHLLNAMPAMKSHQFSQQSDIAVDSPSLAEQKRTVISKTST